jgi:hypothetical protein
MGHADIQTTKNYLHHAEDLKGREDLNLRPPAPKAGALPDCATPRHFCCPHTTVYNRSQALTDPFKVRYRRYASALVTAAYNKYASFLHIRKP